MEGGGEEEKGRKEKEGNVRGWKGKEKRRKRKEKGRKEKRSRMDLLEGY